jgi:glutamyl-tRNA synthetase
LQERSSTLKEAFDAVEGGEYEFLISEPETDETLLLKGAKAEKADVAKHLSRVLELLSPLSENISAQTAKEAVFDYATQAGRSAVLWPMRVALSGKEKSPDPFTLVSLLGKEKSIERLARALEMVQ